VAPATGFGRAILARVRPQTSQTYYHRNQQYSIVGLTNAAGTLVERYTYSAYGTLGIYAANGTVRSSSTYANRYTYTGREWDGELRLYHFRARWYDPATGGFVSRDPLGYVDGMSLYRGYFGVSKFDPNGQIVVRGYPDPKNINGCGNYNSVNFHFQLSSDAPCDGYLIQKVTLTCVLKDCRRISQPCRFDIREEWPGKSVTFYEAWFIPERKRTPKGLGENQHNDSSNLVFEDGFCGTINVTTELRFFCKKQWVDVGGYGPDSDEAKRPQPPVYKWRWAPGQVFHPRGAESLCSMTSIDLPATPDGPEARGQWDGTPAIEEGSGRSHTISFNCCDDCQTDRFGNQSKKWVSSTWSVSTDWVSDLIPIKL
jgi:RHS repeat-associated protein